MEWNWELATRAFAISGAALGLYNAFIGFIRGRRRFKVQAAVDRADSNGVLQVKIINNGTLPVVIDSFYLTRRPNGSGGGVPPQVWFRVDRQDDLPLTIAAGAAEAFECTLLWLDQAIASGNDVVLVKSAEDMKRRSSPVKALTQIAKRGGL